MLRVRVDLSALTPEVTHNLWRDVENGKGRLNFLVTLSGTTRGDSPSNLANWEDELGKIQTDRALTYVRKSF